MVQRKEGETRKSRKARITPFQEHYDSFLERLIAAREAAGMTQRDVGVSLGMFHSWLSKAESGERSVDVMELMRLAELYGKRPDYFLKEE
jgi:transcriptional regulator with XRE-family HTH domain